MKTIFVDAKDTLIHKDGTIFEEMRDLLEKYPNSKLVLTDANEDQFKQLNLDKCPYEVFTLKHDPEKTDPEYFKRLLEKYHIKPEEVVYFEHKSDAVKSARSIGIKSYYYDSEKQDLNALKVFLDENL